MLSQSLPRIWSQTAFCIHVCPPIKYPAGLVSLYVSNAGSLLYPAVPWCAGFLWLEGVRPMTHLHTTHAGPSQAIRAGGCLDPQVKYWQSHYSEMCLANSLQASLWPDHVTTPRPAPSFCGARQQLRWPAAQNHPSQRLTNCLRSKI